MRRWRNIVLVLLVACALVYLGRWAYIQLAIDSCLDRGGSWDYGAEVCIGQREAAP